MSVTTLPTFPTLGATETFTMSNTVVTFRALAESYADKSNTAGNASKRLAEHPDAAAYIARAAEKREKGKGTKAALVARDILGAEPTFPTRVGPKGDQRLNPADPVLARRVESLASWLKAQAPKTAPKPTDYAAALIRAAKAAAEHDVDIAAALAGAGLLTLADDGES